MARGGSEGGVVAGSVVSAGLAICFCSIGIPVVFTGAIMMAVAESGSTVWTVGLILLLISALVLVGGIVIILLLCTDCCGKQGERAAVHPHGPNSVHITTVAVPPPIMQPMQPPSYGLGATPSAYPQPGAGYSQQGVAFPLQPSSSYSNAPAYSSPAAGYAPPPGAPPPPSEKPPAYY